MKRDTPIILFPLVLFLLGLGPLYFVFGVILERLGFARTGFVVVFFFPLALLLFYFTFMRRQAVEMVSEVKKASATGKYFSVMVGITFVLIIILLLLDIFILLK